MSAKYFGFKNLDLDRFTEIWTLMRERVRWRGIDREREKEREKRHALVVRSNKPLFCQLQPQLCECVFVCVFVFCVSCVYLFVCVFVCLSFHSSCNSFVLSPHYFYQIFCNQKFYGMIVFDMVEIIIYYNSKIKATKRGFFCCKLYRAW